MKILHKNYKYFALHAGAALATFKLDDLAESSGKLACNFLENIGAEFIIRKINYCIDPTAIGYGAWFVVIAFVFGGGFFLFFDLD